MKKLLIYLLSLTIISTMMISCSDSDSDDESMDEMMEEETLTDDIIDIAVAASTASEAEFTALVAALTRSENEGSKLITTLRTDGPFTVFAPTDAAFTALLQTISGQSDITLDDIPIDVLENILKYHVISGAKVMSGDITDSNVETVLGTDITLSTSGGVKVNDISVVAGSIDIEGTNGVIHAIEGVLVPKDIADFVGTVLETAYFNKDFTTLVAAAVKADLVSTILAQDAITIFAPTNAAFKAAGIDGSEDASVLADVLKYHVVLATAKAADVSSLGGSANSFLVKPTAVEAAEEVATEYYKLWFSTPSTEAGGGVYVNGIEVTSADLVADDKAGAVVHVIDGVLEIPTDNIADVVIASDNFTLLEAALSKASLVSVFQGSDEYTVFAPTDAAFTTLLDGQTLDEFVNDLGGVSALQEVLKHHVVSGRVYSTDLKDALGDGSTVEALFGDITINLTNLTIAGESSGTAKITSTDINTSNGVIHVIDVVIVPNLTPSEVIATEK
ncbi:fasciclin domain-containing protein [Reichenbachiella versicolor]|uniref:fasciclin domain-containing protein n=1 Tax=Reichenbachiella versicolor TaxID=1821036 RepID=UPI000D6E8E85|nr:fasciclin domain-containing protein [Reichenbachiella versicolor]